MCFSLLAIYYHLACMMQVPQYVTPVDSVFVKKNRSTKRAAKSNREASRLGDVYRV